MTRLFVSGSICQVTYSSLNPVNKMKMQKRLSIETLLNQLCKQKEEGKQKERINKRKEKMKKKMKREYKIVGQRKKTEEEKVREKKEK